ISSHNHISDMRIEVARKPKNPLDLPEIRAAVARYLDRNDLVTCLRVFRDWFKDFVRPVWHTIDLNMDKGSKRF
ncbi:hypothetical protein BGZ96_006285, partial [Linnemannia gamsii]